MRSIICVLVLSFLASGAAPALAQESTAWREVAAAVPLGTKVKVQTTEGRRISGTLMRVADEGVLVKRDARRPEPAETIPYDRIARLERDTGGGVNIGKAIAVGIASGAGVVLGLILFAMQLD